MTNRIEFKVTGKNGKTHKTTWTNGGKGFNEKELKEALAKLENDDRVTDIQIKEDKEMKNNEKTNGQAQIMQIEVDGVKFTQTRPNYYYKNENGKQTRISKAEWEKAFDQYTQDAADNADADEWQEEADRELEVREQKQKKSDKTAENSVNRKPRKSKDIALELDVTYANEDHHITLTAKQVDFLKSLQGISFWDDGIDSNLWCDCIAQDINWNPMSVGAMISTLREKNLVMIGQDRVNGKKCKYMAFTEIGKEVAKALGLH